MPVLNAIYTQSGGMTSVINASACGVIQAAAQHKSEIAKVLAGNNGILGVLQEDLIDTSKESIANIDALRRTPGGAFGSCRKKLPEVDITKLEYKRLLDVFVAHNIGFFFCNGGGDSQDTALKVSQVCASADYPMKSIGIPKTIDNDLLGTDNCPGFGSTAKYVATSVREASLDVASMYASSTRVFILEVMGRNSGWIAASSGLAAHEAGAPPQIILFPEVPFNKNNFLQKVSSTVAKDGYCVVVASEGIRFADGTFFTQNSGVVDSFGHVQLGGVAPSLAALVQEQHGFKVHWAVTDYLQRAARHISSSTDVRQAYAVGKVAVEMALSGENAIMVSIQRKSDQPYSWHLDKVPLAEVANVERQLPASYISADGYSITEAAKTYLLPLIEGEDYPAYKNGLPDYVKLNKIKVPKLLPDFNL